MRELRRPAPAYFFVAMLGQENHLLSRAKDALTAFFGPVEYESDANPFFYTDYYEKELGKDLMRQFLFFSQTRDPYEIVKAKIFTMQIEGSMGRGEGGRMVRQVNIDPGYLTQAKIVLASSKDFSHRIYLGRGVFAEVTLSFAEGSYRPHSYTFPEYSDEKNIALFNRMREHNFTRKA